MKNVIIKLIDIIISFSIIGLIKNRYIKDISYKEALKSKKTYDTSEYITNNLLNKNIKQTKLFFSENKNKYYELSEVSNSSTKYQDIINNSSFYEIPETLISQYEKKYQREKIAKIIRTIEREKKINKINSYNNQNNNYYRQKKIYKNNYNINNEFFSDEYNFYGNKKLLNFEYSYYWNKLISQNSVINELSISPIKELINIEPEQINLEQKICFPITKLVYINNPDSEDNLLIKDIKSDLHQVKIFPYLPDAKGGFSSSINSYFPYSIFPQSKFVFQLLILPDVIEKVSGNLYIKFNDKKVIIIPIIINGLENEYKIKPIYYMNWQINKRLIIPIKIANPNKKKLLIIKDIIHSFNNIELEWPNGVKLTNNFTSYMSSMLQIWPMDSKIIFFIKYISEKVTNEYGFIHLKLDDDTLIVIPILINVKKYSLNTFPGFINFGICDLAPYNRKNFIKMVPLLMMNFGNEDIEIKRVYIDYEDKFLHFHKKVKNENKDKIIVKKNTHNQFGYLIFDGEYEVIKDEKKYVGKIGSGSIFIETNSTIDPFLEVEYFYLTDYNSITKVLSGDVQKIENKSNDHKLYMQIKYEPPLIFQSTVNYLKDNMSSLKDRLLDINLNNDLKQNFRNVNYIFSINFDIKNIDNYYNRYVYVPFVIDQRLYVIFQVEVDNNKVSLAFCNSNNDGNFFPLCIKPYGGFDNYRYNNNKVQYLLMSTQFFFGSISGEINRKKYVYIINDNLYPLIINEIGTSNKQFTLDLEGFYSIDRNRSNSIMQYDYSLKGKLPELITNFSQKENKSNINVNLTLYPKTALLVSINIKSKNYRNKTLEGDIFLSFDNKSRITLSNKANILIGDFSISPSNIKFEPAFPGLYQSKIIFCRNTYQTSLDIISVISTDDRIIPKLLTNKVEPGNKISIIKILFMPDINFLTKDYIPKINMGKSLTYRELYLWKKNEEYWNYLGQNGKTEINANITVVTSLKSKIINVRSFLIKPNLVKKEEIDYGLIQVGQIVEKYIEGYNPSDSILEMRLFLAPDFYNDINNFSMFDLNEQQELYLDKNKVIIILGCSFVVNQNNTLKNFFEYIIIKENINLDNYINNNISKEELLKKLYYYGNPTVRKYLYNSVNVLCKYEKKNKDNILINKNEENNHLISEIFSSNFNNEIDTIKNMTTNKEYKPDLYNQNSTIFGFLMKYFLKFLYLFKKEYFPDIQIQENKQSFYLQENLSKNLYRIQPHQKFKIGPIIFKPNTTEKVSNILFLRNNLTILYPIKLKGEGGGGQITFINYNSNIQSKKNDLLNNNNFIIEINRDNYDDKKRYKNNITRSITLNNTGNLPLIIKNITIDNNECQTDDLKISQCQEFLLDIGEFIDINIEVNAYFGNYIKNRIVRFNTDYQSFELNVIIIAKDLYEQNIYYWRIAKNVLLIFIPLLFSVILLNKLLFKKINKKEIKPIINSNIENKQTNLNDKKVKEKEVKKIYNNEGKRGKRNKNRKYEKIEKENNTKKDENPNEIDKYFKRQGKENVENIIKKEKPEIINNRNKTFGVIILNKDNMKNNVNNDKVFCNINKSINKNEPKKTNEKSESKEKKLVKKKSQNIIETKDNDKDKADINKLKKKDEKDIIKKDNINNNINDKINNIINSNSNISNNINIKININLNSKIDENDSFNNESKNSIKNNNNVKLIEANIIHKDISNTNNNYNYDIKINNNTKSDSGPNNVKTKIKNKVNKKIQKIKKVSNLNELLGITPKKKENKKQIEIPEKKTKVDVKEDNTLNIDSFEQDILNNINKNVRNESKEEDGKSPNNIINNDSLNDNIKNKNEEEQKEKELNLNDDDFDIFDFSTNDIFNSIFKKEDKENEDNDEEKVEDEDFSNYDLFGKQLLNSLYENPFCTKEKKGNLDELLKK